MHFSCLEIQTTLFKCRTKLYDKNSVLIWPHLHRGLYTLFHQHFSPKFIYSIMYEKRCWVFQYTSIVVCFYCSILSLHANVQWKEYFAKNYQLRTLQVLTRELSEPLRRCSRMLCFKMPTWIRKQLMHKQFRYKLLFKHMASSLHIRKYNNSNY